MFNNHLIYRQTVFDACALAALVWAWGEGLVWPMFKTDSSGLSYLIVIAALIAKFSMTQSSLKVSRAKNAHRTGMTIRLKPEGFKAKQEHIGDIIQYCVLLGLAGTLIGIRESVAAIDPNADYAAMIVGVVQGVFTAINTSLVGVAAGIWLEIGRRMLHTATVTLLEDANG